nr:hypothetical protein BaRGS_017917 [Batillaria attramentaria]
MGGEDENIPTDNFTCPGFYRCLESGNCVHPNFNEIHDLNAMHLKTLVGLTHINLSGNHMTPHLDTDFLLFTKQAGMANINTLTMVDTGVELLSSRVFERVLIFRLCVEKEGTSLTYRALVVNLSLSDFLMGVYLAIIGWADAHFHGDGPFKGQDYAFSVFIVLNFVLFLVIGGGQALIFYTIHSSAIATKKGHRKQDMVVARRLFLVACTDFCCWFPIGKRTKKIEQKRMEKMMSKLHTELRSWSSDEVEDLVQFCLSTNLVQKERMLEKSGASTSGGQDSLSRQAAPTFGERESEREDAGPLTRKARSPAQSVKVVSGFVAEALDAIMEKLTGEKLWSEFMGVESRILTVSTVFVLYLVSACMVRFLRLFQQIENA